MARLARSVLVVAELRVVVELLDEVEHAAVAEGLLAADAHAGAAAVWGEVVLVYMIGRKEGGGGGGRWATAMWRVYEGVDAWGKATG